MVWFSDVLYSSLIPVFRAPTNCGKSSGFPYFLQFKSEFGNKEFMI